MWTTLDFIRSESGSCPHPLTWKLLHAVDGAEVVLECTVAVHSHAEVEFWHESEKRACPVTVLDGADAHSQQPVDIQHLLLPRKNTIPSQLTACLGEKKQPASHSDLRNKHPHIGDLDQTSYCSQFSNQTCAIWCFHKITEVAAGRNNQRCLHQPRAQGMTLTSVMVLSH